MNCSKMRQLLEMAVVGRGFYRRGNAYFRVVGDGILQVLKFEYQRCFSYYSLSVGLFSMYSELKPQWFTSSGCIPRYCVMNFVGKSSEVIVNKNQGMYTFEVISHQAQIQTLKDSVFCVLDNTLDQEQLVHQMNKLDIARHGSIIWNDLEKFAPYLKSGDLKSAKKVLSATLIQHGCLTKDADYDLSQLLSDESLSSIKEEDRTLVQRLGWLQNADWDTINHYLYCNQVRNNGFARFCVSRK